MSWSGLEIWTDWQYLKNLTPFDAFISPYLKHARCYIDSVIEQLNEDEGYESDVCDWHQLSDFSKVPEPWVDHHN